MGGTSLPDTFASKMAAQNDPNADASLGNITGSNSVNVFLGLGLPWSIASIYWACVGRTDKWMAAYGSSSIAREYSGGVFVVEAGSLGFSVGVFTICALICIGGLLLRRKLVGAELGGPKSIKTATLCIFCGLWFIYAMLSILKTEGII